MDYRRLIVAAVLSVAAVAALARGASAAAPPKQFVAILNEPQEVPANTGTASGTAYLTFSETTKLLCVTLTYSGLSSPENAAHIHGPALPGVDGSIVFGLPLGNPKNICVGPLANSEKTSLLKNQLYINVHTDNHTGGEIRGQILRIK